MITPHHLRHTCRIALHLSGANVLALSRMLGHADPSITLKAYAELFDTDLDAEAERLTADCAQRVLTACSPSCPVTEKSVSELR